MEQAYNKNYLLFFILTIFALEAMLFSAGNFKLNEQDRLEKEYEEKIKATLDNTEVKALAVSVYNATKNKKIYGKNDGVAMPIASLMKILTVAEGLKGRAKDEIVYVSP